MCIRDSLNVDWDGNELLLSDILGSDADMVHKNLEEDVDRRLDAFRRAFDARVGLSISRHITAPLQAKLPILRELLGTGTY